MNKQNILISFHPSDDQEQASSLTTKLSDECKNTSHKTKDDFEKGEMIFSILLDRPEKFELPMKPSGRREHNLMCTLDMQKVTLASARAEDNGAYSRCVNTLKYFHVTDKICKLAHRMDSGEFFINVRDHLSASRYPVYRKEFVEASKVFLLQRFYRYS